MLPKFILGVCAAFLLVSTPAAAQTATNAPTFAQDPARQVAEDMVREEAREIADEAETRANITIPLDATDGIGKTAPYFTAVDSNGNNVALSDFAGKIVILEWTNHQCPYVRKMYDTGTMQALQKAAIDQGAAWLVVQSAAPGKQGYVDGPAANKILANEKSSPTAYLLDPDGAVGRLYGAQVTPHMFIIDQNGILVYDGAIDDQPSVSHNTVKTANNYVQAALAALAAGEPIATPTSKPYGCAVKY